MAAATSAILPAWIATSRRARCVSRIDDVPAFEQQVVLRERRGEQQYRSMWFSE